MIPLWDVWFPFLPLESIQRHFLGLYTPYKKSTSSRIPYCGHYTQYNYLVNSCEYSSFNKHARTWDCVVYSIKMSILDAVMYLSAWRWSRISILQTDFSTTWALMVPTYMLTVVVGRCVVSQPLCLSLVTLGSVIIAVCLSRTYILTDSNEILTSSVVVLMHAKSSEDRNLTFSIQGMVFLSYLILFLFNSIAR